MHFAQAFCRSQMFEGHMTVVLAVSAQSDCDTNEYPNIFVSRKQTKLSCNVYFPEGCLIIVRLFCECIKNATLKAQMI